MPLFQPLSLSLFFSACLSLSVCLAVHPFHTIQSHSYNAWLGVWQGSQFIDFTLKACTNLPKISDKTFWETSLTQPTEQMWKKLWRCSTSSRNLCSSGSLDPLLKVQKKVNSPPTSMLACVMVLSKPELKKSGRMQAKQDGHRCIFYVRASYEEIWIWLVLHKVCKAFDHLSFCGQTLVVEGMATKYNIYNTFDHVKVMSNIYYKIMFCNTPVRSVMSDAQLWFNIVTYCDVSTWSTVRLPERLRPGLQQIRQSRNSKWCQLLQS